MKKVSLTLIGLVLFLGLSTMAFSQSMGELYHSHKYKDVISMADQILANPNSSSGDKEQAAFMKIVSLCRLKEHGKFASWDDVRKLVEPIAQQFPNSVRIQKNLGSLYFMTKNYSQAITIWQKTLSLATAQRKWDDVFATKESIGRCYEKLNQSQQAVDIWMSVLKDVNHIGYNKISALVVISIIEKRLPKYKRQLGQEYINALENILWAVAPNKNTGEMLGIVKGEIDKLK